MAMKVQRKHTTAHKELINWKITLGNQPEGSTRERLTNHKKAVKEKWS